MKKTITFFPTRAVMMLLATMLLTLTAQTAKAEVSYITDYNGDLELSAGEYEVNGNVTINGGITCTGDVTLTVNGNFHLNNIDPQDHALTLNVSNGSNISALDIDVTTLNMDGGEIRCNGISFFSGTVSGGTIEAYLINASGTISGGTLTATNEFTAGGPSTYDYLTITGGVISAPTIDIYTNTTIYAANASLSITATTYKSTLGAGLTLGGDRSLIDAGNLNNIYAPGALTFSAIAGKTLRPAYTVSYDANDGTGSVASQTKCSGIDITLASEGFTRTGYTLDGWATSAGGDKVYELGGTYSANADLPLYAHWRENIPYIDENGDTQTCTDYTLLRTDNPEHLNFSNLPGGWYVVENWNTDNNVNSGADFSNNSTLHFQGDTHLIICDGAEMSVKLQSSGTLTIYGQSGSSGALNIDNDGPGINTSNDLTINGGIISVSANPGYAIDCHGNLVINGGRVTATTQSGGANAIFGIDGVVINGGKVTATAQDGWAIDGLNVAINGGTVIADGSVDNYATIAEQMIDFTISGTNKRVITESIDDDVVTALQTLFGNNASVDASFKRTFKGGVASTICLPFPMTSITNDGTMYGFVGVTYDDNEGWVATMIDTSPDGDNRLSATEANTPYLFKRYSDGAVTFTGTINTASITAGSASCTDPYWTFNGTYSRLTYSDNLNGQHIFGFAASTTAAGAGNNANQDAVTAGEFVKAIDGAYFPAFRAYLAYTGSEGSLTQARAKRGGETGIPEYITVRLIGKNGEITGIGEIRLSTGEVTFDSNAWHDLNGRKLDGEPTVKGIYINGGHKVVIK